MDLGGALPGDGRPPAVLELPARRRRLRDLSSLFLSPFQREWSQPAPEKHRRKEDPHDPIFVDDDERVTAFANIVWLAIDRVGTIHSNDLFDIVQEGFIALWEALHSWVPGMGRFIPFAIVRVHHRILDARRREWVRGPDNSLKRLKRLPCFTREELLSIEEMNFRWSTRAISAPHAKEIEAKDLLERFCEILGDRRHVPEIFQLLALGYTNAEAARKVGIDPTRVSQMLRVAKENPFVDRAIAGER